MASPKTDGAPILAADYRAEKVTGKRWRRAARVTILNHYLGSPVVAFDEEQVTEIEAQVKASPTETLSVPVDLLAQIDLISPDTGEPLGVSVTHRDVYVALYSLYRQLAAARDAKQQAVAGK